MNVVDDCFLVRSRDARESDAVRVLLDEAIKKDITSRPAVRTYGVPPPPTYDVTGKFAAGTTVKAHGLDFHGSRM